MSSLPHVVSDIARILVPTLENTILNILEYFLTVFLLLLEGNISISPCIDIYKHTHLCAHRHPHTIYKSPHMLHTHPSPYLHTSSHPTVSSYPAPPGTPTHTHTLPRTSRKSPHSLTSACTSSHACIHHHAHTFFSRMNSFTCFMYLPSQAPIPSPPHTL